MQSGGAIAVKQAILAQNTNLLGGIIVMSTIVPYQMGGKRNSAPSATP